jgi:hypothetical protein
MTFEIPDYYFWACVESWTEQDWEEDWEEYSDDITEEEY